MAEKPELTPMAHRATVAVVVQQHADEVAHLRTVRSALLRAPHVRMLNIGRLDERMAAHFDGLSVAGSAGRDMVIASMASLGVGELFAATVGSLEAKDGPLLTRLLAAAEPLPEVQSGLTSAFGWVSASTLQNVTKALLGSANGFCQLVGVTACGMHRVDPSLARIWSESANLDVRARVLRTIGEIGSLTAQRHAATAISDESPSCQFWGAWAAVLLGDRGTALELLADRGLRSGDHRARAFRLSLQALALAPAHSSLQQLEGSPQSLRWLIEGSGIVGDVTYVPWLISHMSEKSAARLAGEAFSLITGINLDLRELAATSPAETESGPNDNPDDPKVDMDPDDGLPWPDAEKIKVWWSKNGGRFQPGTRYFMGAHVTREHCIDVLKNGYQRQRILAAHYLCLLNPGTPLFNTSAPAWRQQKLLAQIS